MGAPGFLPETGGMPGPPQAMGREFCWWKASCIRAKGRVRAAPSSVGQGRLCGGCGDPLCAPHGKQDGGIRVPWRPLWGSLRARALPSSFPQILKKTHSFPKSLEVSPWVAAALSQRGVPDNAWNPPHYPLLCGMSLLVPLCSRARTVRALFVPPLPQFFWL